MHVFQVSYGQLVKPNQRWMLTSLMVGSAMLILSIIKNGILHEPYMLASEAMLAMENPLE